MTKDLAFDSTSVRHYDVDGRLHIERSNISKAQVSNYFGYEIPNCESLGLASDGIYRILRDPEELKKSAATFNNLPILMKHVRVSADNPEHDLVIGSIGSDVEFNAPYLTASTCIWDSKAIAAIESNTMREWSCSYRYRLELVSGVYNGEEYDGIMRDIQANHLALVEDGRAGSDVYVADSNPFKQEEKKMTTPQSARKAKALEKVLAMDEGFSAEQLDKIIDAVLQVEQEVPDEVMAPSLGEPPKEGEEITKDVGNEKLAEFLRSKGLIEEDVAAACAMMAGDACDKDEVEEKAAEKVEAAMDALRKELKDAFKELDQAKADVRLTVGDVIGMDSADQVYRFALDSLKVDHKEVKEAAALRVLFGVAKDKGAKGEVLAKDSEQKKFPGVSRFTYA